jgi:hypothetical protein
MGGQLVEDRRGIRTHSSTPQFVNRPLAPPAGTAAACDLAADLLDLRAPLGAAGVAGCLPGEAAATWGVGVAEEAVK